MVIIIVIFKKFLINLKIFYFPPFCHLQNKKRSENRAKILKNTTSKVFEICRYYCFISNKNLKKYTLNFYKFFINKRRFHILI